MVHVQQPQLAAHANVLQLHYSIRAARQRAQLSAVSGLRSRLASAQVRVTELGEDRALRRLRADLLLMPVSTFMAEEFERLYGPHERTIVLESPAPQAVDLSTQERAAARASLIGSRRGFVLGFLGGSDPRKGGFQLLNALQRHEDVVLLIGGAGVPSHPLVQDKDRVVQVGYVRDLRQFYAACDAFAAVAAFDPGPLTALEASSFGVPVLGTPTCGIVRDLSSARAGVLWESTTPIDSALNFVRQRTLLASAIRQFVEDRSASAQGRRLLSVYQAAVA